MKSLVNVVATGIAALCFAFGTSGCSGYNVRMASLMIDKQEKKDLLIGYACLAKGGSYSQIGILNVALDNPWYSKVVPLFNSHKATEAEDKEADRNTTLQFGSLAYSEGSCFQLGYLNLRSNENPHWYQKVSPLIGWHKEEPETK